MKPTYERDGVRLYLADCLELIPEIDFDLVLTDPPFAVSVRNAANVAPNGTRTLDFFEGDHDWPAMRNNVSAAARAVVDRARSGCSMYWWVGHRMVGDLVDVFEAAEFSTRFLVWSKPFPAPPAPGAGWPSAAEICIYAYRKKRFFNQSKVPRTNVIECDTYRHGKPGKVAHPTQKPKAIARPLIEVSSRAGELVFDPFMGSGTFGVVAVEQGRRYVGIERNPTFFEIARDRIVSAQRSQAFLSGQAIG